MSLYATWGYRVRNMPEHAKWKERPNIERQLPGVVSEWRFEVERGQKAAAIAVHVRVKRQDVLDRIADLHVGRTQSLEEAERDGPLLLKIASDIARVLAQKEFAKFDHPSHTTTPTRPHTDESSHSHATVGDIAPRPAT